MRCKKCSASASWRGTSTPKVAEFQIRVAVMNGFTALGIPLTKVIG